MARLREPAENACGLGSKLVIRGCAVVYQPKTIVLE